MGFLAESTAAKVLIGMSIGVLSGLFLPDMLDYIREVIYRRAGKHIAYFYIQWSYLLVSMDLCTTETNSMIFIKLIYLLNK
jgi:hypothetical protein